MPIFANQAPFMHHPTVFVFNPTCEMAVLNGSVSYMPPARLRVFEQDVSGMMMWVGRKDDCVVVDGQSAMATQAFYDGFGIDFPQALSFAQLQNQSGSYAELRPWGWSPEVCHRFKSLSARFILPTLEWTAAHRAFFSRFTNQRSIDALLPLLSQNPLIDIPAMPLEPTTLEGVRMAIELFGGKAVVKTPWSSSGRGIAMVDLPNNRLVDERWLSGALKQQGVLLIEPLLSKLHDLSFHFWLHADGAIDYLGHNFFSTDGSGKFKGCYLHRIPDRIIEDIPHVTDYLAQGRSILMQALSSLGLHTHYAGPIGVDAMLFRRNDGTIVLHPSIEINMRYTMGYVNLQLRKRLGDDARGQWEIAQFGNGAWAGFCADMSVIHPLVMDGHRPVKGFLPLLPPSGNFGAWLLLE
jgi:hypothetical protein